MKQFLTIALTLLMVTGLQASGQAMSPEEREKALFDSIDKTIERQTELMDLADWQIFRIDSTLVHDYKAMSTEIEELSKAKVSSMDIYTKAQDKWMEQIYNSYRKILNDEQWEKYLKQGAGREKKARDKRAAKALASEAKLKEKTK